MSGKNTYPQYFYVKYFNNNNIFSYKDYKIDLNFNGDVTRDDVFYKLKFIITSTENLNSNTIIIDRIEFSNNSGVECFIFPHTNIYHHLESKSRILLDYENYILEKTSSFIYELSIFITKKNLRIFSKNLLFDKNNFRVYFTQLNNTRLENCYLTIDQF